MTWAQCKVCRVSKAISLYITLLMAEMANCGRPGKACKQCRRMRTKVCVSHSDFPMKPSSPDDFKVVLPEWAQGYANISTPFHLLTNS
jgi:hypothetical protein